MQEGTTDHRGRSYPPQCTTSLSARTIRGRLQQNVLFVRRSLLGPPLTQNHRRLHRQWCDERRVPDHRDENCRLVDAPCCWPGASFVVCRYKLLEAVDTRRYPRAENRVWSDQDPTVTRSTIRADVGVAIVPKTISRQLAEANLKSKRPFRAHPLTPEHRQLRLHWCQAISMWNVTDWQKVVFSDESWFVLGTDVNRVRVWRRPAYDRRSTLIVMCGTLTGQRYVDDILQPRVEPFLNGLPGAIFQQDNARPHTARVAQDFLRHFLTLPWPARSPDLSPVEHVWDQLKRQMASCYSVHDLELSVQDLWPICLWTT
ncbi:transposable element Tcb2 transposase [Trichonephila clavipes]|nr:transposable element Tcb2 transposase [Trichonephila clavipes]